MRFGTLPVELDVILTDTVKSLVWSIYFCEKHIPGWTLHWERAFHESVTSARVCVNSKGPRAVWMGALVYVIVWLCVHLRVRVYMCVWKQKMLRGEYACSSYVHQKRDTRLNISRSRYACMSEDTRARMCALIWVCMHISVGMRTACL